MMILFGCTSALSVRRVIEHRLNLNPIDPTFARALSSASHFLHLLIVNGGHRGNHA